MTTLFWFSVFILIYIYIGYPALLGVGSRFFRKPVRKGAVFPTVSVLLSAYNEEKVIQRKMENLLSLDYPDEKIEILAGSDGSTDETPSILRSYAGEHVHLVIQTERKGKAKMLNALFQKAKGEILVLTDARQRIDRQAIRRLVRNFNDPKVGCASGELVLKENGNSVGKGIGLYWNYEKFIRKTESEIDSVIGATGALYAIRRSVWRPIPEETILDDLYLPMQAVSQGFRTVFDGEARVYDVTSLTPRQEYERKVRTLAGNYQSFVQFASLFNPFRSRVALQFISHKLLRILAPFFLATLLAANGFLWEDLFYRIFFFMQSAFYAMAAVGAFAPVKRIRFFAAPYVFCLLNFSALAGLVRYLSGRQHVTWQKGGLLS